LNVTYSGGPGQKHGEVLVAGVATDGVDTLTIVDANGHETQAPVRNNVYAADVPNHPTRVVVGGPNGPTSIDLGDTPSS
jgi:hypothetical protein